MLVVRLEEQLLPARRCTTDGVAGSLRLTACASSSGGWLPGNTLLAAVPTNKQARRAQGRTVCCTWVKACASSSCDWPPVAALPHLGTARKCSTKPFLPA